MRRLSKQAFGRANQLEIALAAAHLDNGFTFEELKRAVVEAADDAGVEPPSDSTVRKDLERIRDVYGAISRLDRPRGTLERHEARDDHSAFWAFCRELAERLPADGR